MDAGLGWAICCPDGKFRLEARFQNKKTAEALVENVFGCEIRDGKKIIDVCPGGEHTIEAVIGYPEASTSS